jgi:hypothetical protein
MRHPKLSLIILAALGVIAAGIIVWLASPPPMPPAQKIEQTIPDDHIPR